MSQLKETLGSTVTEAYTFLEKIHECLNSLTMKSQLISEQLHKIFTEIKGAPYPTSRRKLYDQDDSFQMYIQAIDENSTKTKQLLHNLWHLVKQKVEMIQQLVFDVDPQYNATFAARRRHLGRQGGACYKLTDEDMEGRNP